MEIIERYIYAVTKRLPQSQREDITQELKSFIWDMMDERRNDLVHEDDLVREVLKELGSPKLLAEKYRETKRYLIGPVLFDTYLTILKIVLFAIIIAVTVGLLIEFLSDPGNVAYYLLNFIISLLTTSLGAFTWVTIIFALVEYFGVDASSLDLGKNNEWQLADLPQIPDHKKQIKRYESVFGVIFAVIGITLFTFFSHYVGAYVQTDEGLTIIPILNEAMISTYLPLVTIIFGLIILKECLKFITGKWTMNLVWLVFLINTVTLFMVFIMIKDHALWNPNFIEELVQTNVITPGSEGFSTMIFIWERSTFIVLIIMIFILVADTINGFVRARK